MALKIRLARGGAKKRPFYRIVVADSRSPRDGRFIERVGTYDPLLPRDHEERVKFNDERVRYWLDHGAQPTDRVAKFFGHAEIIPLRKYSNPEKAKPKAKAQERLAEQAAAKVEAAAAAEAAKAAPEEVVVEEPAVEESAVEEPAAEEPAAEESAAEESAAEATATDDAVTAEADADEAGDAPDEDAKDG